MSERRLPLDYAAVGTGSNDEFQLATVKRTSLTGPPQEAWSYGRSTYAPCGALVGVSVNPTTGQVKVEDCVSVLNSGKLHSPELVSGQSQGGIAMAIGYTLMEKCPITADGPGNGTWNLDRYHLAKMRHIPKNQRLVILDPSKDETTARGIAEAVMCPIPPAILNALADATGGHRFATLPVKSSDVKLAFQAS